jgi:hypothetical protein
MMGEQMTKEQWEAEGTARFGSEKMQWRFVCPSCGHVASVQDYSDAEAPCGTIAYSCIGRYLPDCSEMGEKPGPCNYAGGGLFRLNPVEVEGESYFAFADTMKQNT